MARPRLAGLALALAACASLPQAELPAQPPRGAVRVDAAELGECARRRDPVDLDLDDGPLPADLELVLAEVPPEIQRIAEAAGIRRLLAELLRARADTTRDAPLALQLQLVTRLSALEIEVASLLFEAQCVGNQMESTLREIEALQRRREVALTVTSILVGAAAATAGGIWDLRGGDPRGPATLSAAEAVLYGGGGLYDGPLVDIRERMFDVLESHLNAIDHDLELLYRYTARLVEAEAASRPPAP